MVVDCKCIVNIVYLPTCVYAHYCLLLFDELMGHSVLNDVLCVSSGALYTTCALLCDPNEECCSSRDHLPYCYGGVGTS